MAGKVGEPNQSFGYGLEAVESSPHASKLKSGLMTHWWRGKECVVFRHSRIDCQLASGRGLPDNAYSERKPSWRIVAGPAAVIYLLMVHGYNVVIRSIDFFAEGKRALARDSQISDLPSLQKCRNKLKNYRLDIRCHVGFRFAPPVGFGVSTNGNVRAK